MKEFNTEKFCNDLVSFRGKESPDIFARKLGYLMSGLEESDKLKIKEVFKHIRIGEKYEMLAMRRENELRTI